MYKAGDKLECVHSISGNFNFTSGKVYEIALEKIKTKSFMMFDDYSVSTEFHKSGLDSRFCKAAILNKTYSEAIKNDSLNNGGSTKNPTPEYYGAKCKCGRKIDWYVIGDAYRKNKGSAWDHAGKKLLRAGEGHKTLEQDIKEVMASLNRWLEQIKDEAL